MATNLEIDQGDTKRQVLVVEGANEPYGLECSVRGHASATDNSDSSGGLDTGPDPFELPMAALGACATMTVRMYVDRKAVEVRKISVSVKHDELSKFESPELWRVVLLDGLANDMVLQRLRDIADRCPVHKLIAAGTCVRTEFIDSSAQL